MARWLHDGQTPWWRDDRIPYLGLENKVKLWCSDVEMCQKIMAHWLETEEGSCEDDNEMNFLLKEIWDGECFSELSWFWNPDADWTSPAKCPESGCSGVIHVSSCDIKSLLQLVKEQMTKSLNVPNVTTLLLTLSLPSSLPFRARSNSLPGSTSWYLVVHSSLARG